MTTETQMSFLSTEPLENNTTHLVTTAKHLTSSDEWNHLHEDGDRVWSVADTLLDTPSTSTSMGEVVYQIQIWYTPVLVVMGTVANIITSVITMGPMLRKLSSSHYLCAISLVHGIYLAMLFLKWLTTLGYNIYHRPIACQLVDMLCNISSFLSIWLAVALCVDRYIATSWPPESPRMCAVIRARIVICLMVVISIIIYLNTSLTVGVIHLTSGPLCVPLPMPFRNKPEVRLLEIIGNHAVPFAAIAILLCLMVRTIYKSNRGLTPLFQPDNSHLRHATLLFFSAFLLFQIPADALKTVLFISKEFVKRPKDDKLQASSHFRLLLFVVEYVAHTGMAMNLVILSASYPLFRQSLNQRVTAFKKNMVKLKASGCSRQKDGGVCENMQLNEGCNDTGNSLDVCVSVTSTTC